MASHFKLFLSESECNVPMELCLAPPKGKSGGGGDSGSPLIVKGTDGSHTLVGVLSGPIRKLPDGKKVINSVGVSGKSQSNVINRKRQTGIIFFL